MHASGISANRIYLRTFLYLSPQRVQLIDYISNNEKTHAPRYAGADCSDIIKNQSVSLVKSKDEQMNKFLQYSDLQFTIQDAIKNAHKYDGAAIQHSSMKKLAKLVKGVQ